MKSRSDRIVKGILTIGIATTVSCSTVFSSLPVAAAVSSQAASITIAPNVTAVFHDADLIVQDKKKIASFTIEIINNSSSKLSLMDYWAKIANKDGKVYQTNLKASDKEKEQVPPKSSTYLTYYANVDLATNYADLSLNLIKWDFSSSNYEKKLGVLKTADKATGEVSTNSTGIVLYGESQLRVGSKLTMLYTDADSAYVTTNVFIENESSSNVNLSNLKMFIQSKSNKAYALNTSSVNSVVLQPKESRVLSLQTIIPKNEMNQAYSLILASYDDSNKLNIPIGMFSLSALSETVATKPGQVKQTYVSGKLTNVSSENSYISLNENKEWLTTTINLENQSNAKINANNLEYFVKTKDGYLYPLTAENTSITLLPKIKQSVQISGEIPGQSILSTSQIIVTSVSEDKLSNAYLANFSINTNDQTESGAEATYNGFSIKQTTLNRIPNDLKDLIVAEFSVTNTTETAKSKLDISGYFKIDGVKLEETPANIVVLDDLATIGPGQAYNVLAYMEIPYNQVTNKIEFVMQEKAGEQSVKPIFQFYQADLSNPVTVSSSIPYEISSLGKQSQVKFLKSNVYSGTTNDFFYAELEYTNKERRSIAPAQLAGYIQNQEGSVINVEFSNYTERVQPNGKIIISAWAQIPHAFEEKKLDFYFGEAFKLNETETNAVVKPVLSSLSIKEIDVKKDFINMSISNYMINLRNLYVSLDLPDGLNADGINLSFDYDLTKNESAYPNAEDQKIMIEFIDHGDNGLTYTKELSFDPKVMNDETLLVGKDLKKTIKFSESGLYFKTDMKDVTINVYNVFKDNRMLLATRDIKWFTKTP